MKAFAIILAISLTTLARADEGMWLLDQLPRAELEKRYGFSPDDRWVEHVRLAAVRVGASGSLVSARGLVMTNHHVARDCIEELSSPEKDYIRDGFLARTEAEELRCPDEEVAQLVAITDVSTRIAKATAGLAAERWNAAEKAEMSRIEKECGASDTVRCDVVRLHNGGLHHLYRYRRYQDVRLVFAPEDAAPDFGGDPDNFNFPRYAFDVAFLRAYENGKPAHVEHFFAWNDRAPREGDLTFVVGHPGRTERALTVAELIFQRDVELPRRLLYLAEYRGMLTEFGRRGREQARIVSGELAGIENSYKARRGRWEALLTAEVFGAKSTTEANLRTAVAARPELVKTTAGAWDAIVGALVEQRALYTELDYLERDRGFDGDLWDHAKTLVRGVADRTRPSDQRLREFRDSAIPSITQDLFSNAPIYDELEIARLTFSLTKLREELGADHPVTKKVLGKESPEELAGRLVKGTQLRDVAVRRRLWDGGPKTIAASNDPMIILARLVDPDGRAIRKRFEDRVEAVLHKNAQAIAHARFVLGTSAYPDATGTLRLSFGQLRGYDENGRHIDPTTTLAGLFERATGRPPFAVSATWSAAKKRLALDTPYNMVTTNDIIGGNSGSPVIDREARVVGLVFDGNIQSLAGDYFFDEKVNRTVAVSAVAILHVLDVVYGASGLTGELRAGMSNR